MVRKGILWTIEEHSYFVYYPIISYLRIRVDIVETIYMGRFFWNNGVSDKYNPSKYCGITVWDENSLVRVIWYL